MIDIIDLNKTFNNKVEAVKDFSLKVEKGEVISLIGPSGSGKSTVLRCIAGLETPDKGKILIKIIFYIRNNALNRFLIAVFCIPLYIKAFCLF